MAKEIKEIVKLQIEGWKANPAPPVGTALWPTGIQIADFCKQFNDATRDKMGVKIPVEISIYDDRSFSFIMKEPPMSYLIKTELGLDKWSSLPHKDKVANLTEAQLEKIAEAKMPDLNAASMDAAKRIVKWTARSMWITTDID